MRIFYPAIPVINNTVWLFLSNKGTSQQRDARGSYFVNDSPFDPCTSGYYQLRSRIYAEHALAYAMAANAGVVKVTELTRTRLSNDLETMM